MGKYAKPVVGKLACFWFGYVLSCMSCNPHTFSKQISALQIWSAPAWRSFKTYHSGTDQKGLRDPNGIRSTSDIVSALSKGFCYGFVGDFSITNIEGSL